MALSKGEYTIVAVNDGADTHLHTAWANSADGTVDFTPNPGAEGETRTNLATTPSFETVGANVTVRTNLATNPRANTATGFSTSGTGQVVSTALATDIVGLPGGVSTAWRLTYTTPPTGASAYIGTNTGAISLPGTLAAGTPLTLAIYARSSTPIPALHPRINGLKLGGVVGTADYNFADPVALPAGQWVQVGGVVNLPVAVDTLYYNMMIANANTVIVAGTVIELSCVLFEQSPVLQPYFDGTSRPVLRTNYGTPVTDLGTAAANATNNISFTGATDNAGVRFRTATFGARAGASGTSAWQRWLPAIRNLDASPARAFQGQLITIETVVTANRNCRVRLFSQVAHPTNTTGHTDVMSGFTSLAAGVPTAVTWTWTPTVAQPGNTAFNASAGLMLEDALSDTSDGTVLTYREFDVYVGGYDAAREFVAPGQADSTGLVCEWAGAENNSPSIVVDPDFTTAWTGTAGASTSVLQGQAVPGVSLNSTGGVAISSARWSASGERSVRCILKSATGAEPMGQLTIIPATGDLRGRSFRFRVTCWNPEAPVTMNAANVGLLCGPNGQNQWIPGGSGRPSVPTGETVYTHGPVVYAPTGASDVAPNALGARVQAPAKTEANVGRSLWWDALVVEDVTDGVPEDTAFFDGSFDNTPGFEFAWAGTAHASTSTKRDTGVRTFFGSYTDDEPVTSLDPARYKWQMIRGDAGSSAFLHTAWASSPDGKDDFATNNIDDGINRPYMGTFTTNDDKYTPVYSDYSWVLVQGIVRDLATNEALEEARAELRDAIDGLSFTSIADLQKDVRELIADLIATSEKKIAGELAKKANADAVNALQNAQANTSSSLEALRGNSTDPTKTSYDMAQDRVIEDLNLADLATKDALETQNTSIRADYALADAGLRNDLNVLKLFQQLLTVAGGDIVRTNYAPNPNSVGLNPSGASIAGTGTNEIGALTPSGSWRKFVVSTSNTGVVAWQCGFGTGTNAMAVSPGEVITATMYAYVSTSTAVQFGVRATNYNSAGASLSPEMNSGFVTLKPGVWSAHSVTFTVPATAAFTNVRGVWNTGVPVGQAIGQSSCLVEKE